MRRSWAVVPNPPHEVEGQPTGSSGTPEPPGGPGTADEGDPGGEGTRVPPALPDQGGGDSDAGPDDSEPTPPRSGPGWARLAVRYPIPFVALAGLGVGAALLYLTPVPGLASWVWLGTLLAGGIPLVAGTAWRLLHRRFASDVIAMLAIVAAIALDQAFAGVIIVLMQSGGDAIDHHAFRRASSSLEALLRRAPRWARRRVGEAVERIPADRVRVGDLLVVPTGEMLPVDGAVVSPQALIDESTISGEAFPQRRAKGDAVLSGTVNVGPPFDLVASRESGQSQYARIVDLVRAAQERKPTIQRLADRYAVWFTPLTIAVAVIGWVLTTSPVTALSVLVVATPCPLIIATPIAVIGAINRASNRGIVVKSGGAIEEVGRARVVVFDKTGTITSGQPQVEAVIGLADGVDRRELLETVAPLEALSSHPLAAAVLRSAKEAGARELAAREVEEIPGAGVEGLVEGRRVLVGSPSLVGGRLAVDLVATWARVRSETSLEGRTVSFVAVDGRIAGAIVFADRLRPGVVGMVAELHRLGVERLVLLTGDRRENGERAGAEAGLTEVHAELLPQQKVDWVRRYRNEIGSTVMAGDGVNDAAALAAASVGVALGARGAAISAEAADIVLLVDDVTRVVDAISIGRRMVKVAQQGIVFGLGASLLLMGIAASGHVVPAIGAALQELIDLAVILNALRVA